MESSNGLKENLIRKLKELGEMDPGRFKDEAATKLGIVLPILQILGWKVFDIEEVTPEYSSGSGRVDYALNLQKKAKVFIEVKKAEEELSAHQEQLIYYAFHEGVPFAILTNGYTWELYLPLLEGNWQEKKVIAIDWREQDIEEAAESLIRLLARDSVHSGQAEDYAKELHGSRERERKIKETLPKAWEQIISKPNEKLIELLADETESICGFKPEESAVKDFLSRLAYASTTKAEEVPTTPPTRETRRIRQQAGRQAEDPTGKIPSSVNLFGRTYQVTTWREVLLTVANELIRKHPEDYESKLLSVRGTKHRYFSKNPRDLRGPKRLQARKGLYTETNLSAVRIIRICGRILQEFGHSPSDFKVTYR